MSEGISKAGSVMIPTIRYFDAASAIDWLCATFGFEKRLVVPGENGDIIHSQLVFGTGMIMVGSVREGILSELQAPLESPETRVSQSAYIIVTDINEHFDRAVAAGAKIVIPLEAQEHGGSSYSCRDPEGQLWHFGDYNPWDDE